MPPVQLLPQMLPVSSVAWESNLHDICAATRAFYHWTTETDKIPVVELAWCPAVSEFAIIMHATTLHILHRCWNRKAAKWCSANEMITSFQIYLKTLFLCGGKWKAQSHLWRHRAELRVKSNLSLNKVTNI